MQEKQTYVLSLGAGVNSVALMVWLLDNRRPLQEVVFADTGGELPETYEYLDVVRKYLRDVEIPYREVSTRIRGKRDLYMTCHSRRVIPSVLWRWSTRDFKVTPIHRYYRSLGGHVNQYMAIAYDEWHRMRDSGADFVTNIYPLVDEKITREGCIEIIRTAGLPIPPKSGCFFCPFNSLPRWKSLNEEHPDLYEKAMHLEENSKHFPSQRLTDQVFRDRDSVTLRQLRDSFRDGVVLTDAQAEAGVEACGAECFT